jgi:hypothetical protein
VKKQLTILIILLAPKENYCQKIGPVYIDSIINLQNKITNCYQYNYSSLEKKGTVYTSFDFITDTATRQLLKVIYTEEGNKALIVSYNFYHNQLLKVKSMTRDETTNNFTVGEYYFDENKLVKKKGKNLSLQNDGLFKKISPGYILKQQEYLIAQFHYFINN